MLPVQVVRACRQAHLEANPIIWSTNTMSFIRHGDCHAWMSDRLAAQKALITGLHLKIVDSNSPSRWTRVAGAQSVVKALIGLESLHLSTRYVHVPCQPSRLEQAEQI